jgi:hypothetical protein
VGYLDPDDEQLPAAKLRWQPFVGMAAYAVANLFDSVHGFWRAVGSEFFAEANRLEEQEDFRVRAALEIEALTSDAPLLVSAWAESDDDDDEYDDGEDED